MKKPMKPYDKTFTDVGREWGGRSRVDVGGCEDSNVCR